MSDTRVCLAAFVLLLLFLLVLARIWRTAAGPCPPLRESLDLYRTATDGVSRFVALLYASLPIVRLVLGTGFFAMAAAAFSCLAAICGWSIAGLQVLGEILLKILDRVLGPQAQHSAGDAWTLMRHPLRAFSVAGVGERTWQEFPLRRRAGRANVFRPLMAHRLASEAEADLDDIWHYIATEGGNLDTADRLDQLSLLRLIDEVRPHEVYNLAAMSFDGLKRSFNG